MYTNNNSNSGGRPYRKEDASRDKQKIELAEFSIEDFRPEVFIQKALSNVSEKGVRGFLDTLRESRELAAGDLQKNVYKNYNEFLESDMFVLRGLLNELRNISDNLRDDSTESVNLGPVAPVASEPIVSRGRQPTRNNATDIQSIWKAQIQLLWDHVEGAQKLVPLVPGRHIVREFSNFVEINAKMFLGARSKNIRIRTKQLKFEGDIPQYINELSLVYFTLIKNTCDWYNAAFRDMRMASGLVKWVNEEFEHYSSMFKRQLRTVGFDLKFLLESLLKPDPDETDDNDEPNFTPIMLTELKTNLANTPFLPNISANSGKERFSMV
ncbi:15618_t:CDS:10 [Entrophospora sp. SA101]|nr:15618_t:CDS:10 [Entrophospora sp. SA101]